MSVATILQYKGYSIGPESGEVNAVVANGSIEHWDHADPQPTQEQLDTWAAEPGYQVWLDEHGGDAAKTARRKAKELLDDPGELGIALRSLIDQIHTRDVNDARVQTSPTVRDRATLINDAKSAIDSGNLDT